MDRKKRALITAICTTLGALAFAFSFAAMTPDVISTISSGNSTQGVVYTFESYRCVGNGSQYERCGWIGTVTADGVVESQNVEFRDAVSPEVQAGETIEALWSYRDPLNAWSLEGSRAWLNSMASAAVSLLGVVLLGIGSIYWWRQYSRESKVEAEKRSNSDSSDEQRREHHKKQKVSADTPG